MSDRVAVLLLDSSPRVSPPGVDPAAYARALAEDVADLLHELDEVDSLVVTTPEAGELARSIVWPGTPVVEVAEAGPYAALTAAAEAGYGQAVVVAADVPDLPQIVIAKLFKALSRAEAALAPAENGGLVALGARLPAPHWLAGAALDSAPDDVRAAAPERRRPPVTVGWRRLRTAADVGALDPELEGWEATRALLSAPGE